MYICIYVYMYICIYVYMCIYIYVYICVYISRGLSQSVRTVQIMSANSGKRNKLENSSSGGWSPEQFCWNSLDAVLAA